MRKTVFLKIPKRIYHLNLKKKAHLASVLCVFVSDTVSGSIKSDLGDFWFLFFSLYIIFPKVGDRDEAAERNHRRKRDINSLPMIRSPRNSPWITGGTISPLPIPLLHSSRLYTKKELRVAKLCKQLLREQSNEAFFTTRVTQTIGRSLRDYFFKLACNCKAAMIFDATTGGPHNRMCSRLLFYSKCTGFTVCFTHSIYR